jgi:hypothetical protein
MTGPSLFFRESVKNQDSILWRRHQPVTLLQVRMPRAMSHLCGTNHHTTTTSVLFSQDSSTHHTRPMPRPMPVVLATLYPPSSPTRLLPSPAHPIPTHASRYLSMTAGCSCCTQLPRTLHNHKPFSCETHACINLPHPHRPWHLPRPPIPLAHNEHRGHLHAHPRKHQPLSSTYTPSS